MNELDPQAQENVDAYRALKTFIDNELKTEKDPEKIKELEGVRNASKEFEKAVKTASKENAEEKDIAAAEHKREALISQLESLASHSHNPAVEKALRALQSMGPITSEDAVKNVGAILDEATKTEQAAAGEEIQQTAFGGLVAGAGALAAVAENAAQPFKGLLDSKALAGLKPIVDAGALMVNSMTNEVLNQLKPAATAMAQTLGLSQQGPRP